MNSKSALLILFSAVAAVTAAWADEQVKPRAARSVHLGYQAPDATVFYNEITVRQSTAGSYFMACGFAHGYFGIQEQSEGKKVVIFSVWDPTSGDDPRTVSKEDRVEVLYKADDVVARRFGGEGTGAQSFFPCGWKIGQTYRFLVKATVTGKKTAYAAHFFLPESNAWKHLVTFRTITGGSQLQGLYSFIEDFRRDGKSATEVRRATFGNGWIRDQQGKWLPLLQAKFTASDATWEAKDTIDAGVLKDSFYLQTGGDTVMKMPLHTKLKRAAGEGRPPELPNDERVK